MTKKNSKRIINLDKCETGTGVNANLFNNVTGEDEFVDGVLEVVEVDGEKVVYLKHDSSKWDGPNKNYGTTHGMKYSWRISEELGLDNLLPNENCKSLSLIE